MNIEVKIRQLLNEGEMTTHICTLLGVDGMRVREQMEAMKERGHPRFRNQTLPKDLNFQRIVPGVKL
jgi:hypothetical protein